MICKDCLYYPKCYDFGLDDECSLMVDCEKNCKDFKDKKLFIELPCKVGDTVYVLLNEPNFQILDISEYQVVGFTIGTQGYTQAVLDRDGDGREIRLRIETLNIKWFLSKEAAEAAKERSENE